MIASLYQSGSCKDVSVRSAVSGIGYERASAKADRNSAIALTPLRPPAGGEGKVARYRFRQSKTCSALDAEDRGRVDMGMEAQALAGALPAVLHPGEQFHRREGFTLRDAHRRKREFDGRLARADGIERHGDEDPVGAILGHLAVEQHLSVIRRVEAQIGEAVQRRIVAADAVELGD